jgi:hypothetical protein
MQKLAVIAIAGLTLSAVCFGGVAAVGAGQGVRDTGWNGLDFSMFSEKPRCEAVPGATATNRTLDWDGSDTIGLSVGGTATWSPSNDGKVHVSGDPQLIAHVRVEDGGIELNCRGSRGARKSLRITLPGGPFKRFSIAGSGNLEMKGLNQQEVTLSIAGSGNIKADGQVEKATIRVAGSGDVAMTGRVTDADIHIAGSGNVRMGQAQTRTTKVRIAGSGEADIAPTERADIHISGSGDVNLFTHPREQETSVAGSGRIRHVSRDSGI